MNVNCNC